MEPHKSGAYRGSLERTMLYGLCTALIVSGFLFVGLTYYYKERTIWVFSVTCFLGAFVAFARRHMIDQQIKETSGGGD